MPFSILQEKKKKKWKVSGQTKTKEFEGFRDTMYKDTRGKNTIGYGFNVDDPTVKESLPGEVTSGKRPITQIESDVVFDKLYSRAKSDAVKFIGNDTFKNLSSQQQDIVTDMAYNMGASKLGQFKKFKQALQEGNQEKAVQEMKNSRWFSQTGRRALHHVSNFIMPEAGAAEIPQPKREEIKQDKPSFYEKNIRPTLQTLNIVPTTQRSQEFLEVEESSFAQWAKQGFPLEMDEREPGKSKIGISPQIADLKKKYDEWSKTPKGKYLLEPVNDFGESKFDEQMREIGQVVLLVVAGGSLASQSLQSPLGQRLVGKMTNSSLFQKIAGKEMSVPQVKDLLQRVTRGVGTKADRAIFDKIRDTVGFSQVMKSGVTGLKVPRFGGGIQPQLVRTGIPFKGMKMYSGLPIPFKPGDAVKMAGKSFKFLGTAENMALLSTAAGKEIKVPIDEIKTNFMKMEAEVLKKAGIPEKDLPRFLYSKEKGGEKLRAHTESAMRGEITEGQAVTKAKEEYNTFLDNFDKEAKKVVEMAKAKQPALNKMVDEVGKEFNLNTEKEPKSLESLKLKVERKSDPNYDVYSPKDHARGMIILDNFSQVPDVIKSLNAKQKFQGESTLSEPLNKFGYRGINLTTPLGDDINGEIQLHTKETKAIKDVSDEIYRKWRPYEEFRVVKVPEDRKAEFLADMEKSNSLWSEWIKTQDLGVIEDASSSVKGLESVIMPRVPSKSTQPSVLSTKGLPPDRIGSESKIRPSLSREKRVDDITPPSTKDIPQETTDVKGESSLIEEAKKYKTADEFVESGNIKDVKETWKSRDIKANISEFKGIITLSKIVIPEGERGKGLGTEAMQELFDYADKSGQVIGLTPDKTFGATSMTRLTNFYKRLGFKENKGRNKNFLTKEKLIRNPNVEQGEKLTSQLTDIWDKAQEGKKDVALPVKKEAPPAPPKIPPSEIAGAEGPEGEGAEVLRSYEKQKDIWFGNKDERLLLAKVEKRILQKQMKTAMGKPKYDNEIKDYDRAIQVYIDSKRNPEHITKFYNDLTDEQKRIVDLSQNLPQPILEIADKIAKSYSAIGLEAKESDVIRNVLDNYVGRVWNLEEKAPTEKFRKFGVNTKHSKARKLETIIEGWAKGLELKVEGATNNLEIIKEEIVKTIEDKRFLKALKKMKTIEGGPLVTTKNLEGYKQIEHPNFTTWKLVGNSPETEGEGNLRGRNMFRTEEGDIYERQNLYAPEHVAKNLNNILGISKLKGIYLIDKATKYNAIAKAWILQSSFFHHLAFTNSYWYGTNDKKWNELSLRQAYKQGISAIEKADPTVMIGVRNGLTLGIKQDWSEELLHEKTVIGEILDKNKASKATKDKILALRQQQADFLFGEFGAGLKAKSFMIEFRNLTKKHPDLPIDDVAKMAANLINDDFGGLHLGRMGRNPTVQHIFRLIALAPDWTESNVKTMTKIFKGSEKSKWRSSTNEEANFYRKFWAGIFTKTATLTILANLAMSALDEDDDGKGVIGRFMRNYKIAGDQGWQKLRWMDVDITPIYKATGGKTKQRKYFSIIGHFKDPIKFILRPIRSAHHKGSVLYKFFHEALTGVDWAGRRFTTTPELLGLDDKGKYKTTRKGKYKKGDPKGGKLKGQTVTWDFRGKGPLSYLQIISFGLAQAKGWQPIQVQNLLSWMAGEQEGFDATLKSAGFRVSTTYDREEKEKKKKKKWKVK